MLKKAFLSLALALLLAFSAAPALAQGVEQAADISALLEQAEGLLQAHIEELADDYARYYDADEYRLMFDDYQGQFGGVGISMIDDEQNRVVVYGVIADTPAGRDGTIQPGDIIAAVDGENILGLDSSLAALKIRGEVGQPVTLTLLRESDGLTLDVTLIREIIHSESVTGQLIAQAADTAYISVYDFSEQTAEDFVELYNELRGASNIRNLIIDLRSNGGGSFYAAINIANYFTKPGQTIVSEKTADGLRDYQAVSGQLHGLNLYILLNRWSASASEVLSGALRDNAGAVLIGDQSFGKGITQGLSQLRSGAGLRYTRSRYYTPSGFDLHGAGLAPDIAVDDPEGISSSDYFSYDPALNPHLRAALECIADKDANNDR